MQISVQAEIERRLTEALNSIELTIIDDSLKHKGHLEGGSGEGTHFRIQIISDNFKGLSRIERHQLVHRLLDDLIKTKIHALSLKLATYDECP